jgi:flagellar hook-length control protein FliK
MDIMSLAKSRGGGDKQNYAEIAKADKPAHASEKASAKPSEAASEAKQPASDTKAAASDAKPAEAAKGQTAEAEKAGQAAASAATGSPDAEISAKITAAAEKILGAVAEELGLTLEDILAVLAALGMIPAELLDPANLRELLAELTAADPLALVTDGSLYDSLSDLMNKGQALTEGLLAEADLTPEELAKAIEQLKAAAEGEAKGEPDSKAPLTEPVNLTNATAEQQASEASQKVTITIEKDGQVTEIVAKADEKGNVTGIKDVQTSEAEPTVVITTKGEAGDQAKQQAGQHSQQPSGHESLLNSLLQTRVAAVEARLEPILMPEGPNTEMIMRQIMDYMKIQLGPEVDRLEMQLHPAHLGTVSVKIAAQAGVITAQFIAQNEMVKAAIESQIVELKDNMRQQGLKVETVEVHVESQAFNSSLWQQGQSDEAGEEQKGQTRRRINLNDMDLDELTEDMSDEERLNAEMMVANGQTVDYQA